MTYKLIFSRGKYDYFTNIFFNDFEEEMAYFKSYASSINFNDNEDSAEFFISEGWFNSKKDSQKIFDLLNKNSDSIIVRLSNEYLVLTKKDFPEWEKLNVLEIN